jgi:rhodanese-related sulfurtransferase
MPTDVDRDQVRQLVRDGATLVEVLPARGYEDEHISGAINIPLAVLDEQAPKQLSRDEAIIVYCYDLQ